MPQDGSKNYYYPPGTPGIPDTTIESEAYNTFLDDLVVNDLNFPRPVHRGGTGADSADKALVNLHAEKAEQVVTAYLSHVWLPGSFRSAASATDAPVAGHAFAGVCYINEPLVYPPTNANVTLEARDQNDTLVPGRKYIRQKIAGVWGAWSNENQDIIDLKVDRAGDTMTGHLVLPGDGAADAATLSFGVPGTGLYGDGNTVYVTTEGTVRETITVSGIRAFVPVILMRDPALAMEAATKQYVDTYAAPVSAIAYSGLQINGGFNITQERTTAASVSGLYVCDGWILSYVGTGLSVSGTPFSAPNYVAGFSNMMLFQVLASKMSPAAGDYAMIYQAIEGFRCTGLAWGTVNAKPITLAFWSSHSRPGTYTGTIHNSANARTYAFSYTQAASNVPQYNVIPIPGDQGGTWLIDNGVGMRVGFCFGAGSSVTASLINTWVDGPYVAGPGQVNAFQSTSDVCRILGVAILPGAVTIDGAALAMRSAFIMRPYDQELMTCKRQYQRIYSPAGAATGNGTAQIIYWSFPLQVSMRTVPTASIEGSLYFNSYVGPYLATDVAINNCLPDTWNTTLNAASAVPAGTYHAVSSAAFAVADARLA